MTSSSQILDPVCDMVVDIAQSRDAGLSLELPEREYAFCSAGCLAAFAKQPTAFKAKVETWFAKGAAKGQPEHPQGAMTAEIDAGMRAWYQACRCCMHDVYPELVEQLDAERDAHAEGPAAAGICETAEAQPPTRP